MERKSEESNINLKREGENSENLGCSSGQLLPVARRLDPPPLIAVVGLMQTEEQGGDGLAMGIANTLSR